MPTFSDYYWWVPVLTVCLIMAIAGLLGYLFAKEKSRKCHWALSTDPMDRLRINQRIFYTECLHKIIFYDYNWVHKDVVESCFNPHVGGFDFLKIKNVKYCNFCAREIKNFIYEGAKQFKINYEYIN